MKPAPPQVLLLLAAERAREEQARHAAEVLAARVAAAVPQALPGPPAVPPLDPAGVPLPPDRAAPGGPSAPGTRGRSQLLIKITA